MDRTTRWLLGSGAALALLVGVVAYFTLTSSARAGRAMSTVVVARQPIAERTLFTAANADDLLAERIVLVGLPVDDLGHESLHPRFPFFTGADAKRSSSSYATSQCLSIHAVGPFQSPASKAGKTASGRAHTLCARAVNGSFFDQRALVPRRRLIAVWRNKLITAAAA